MDLQVMKMLIEQLRTASNVVSDIFDNVTGDNEIAKSLPESELKKLVGVCSILDDMHDSYFRAYQFRTEICGEE